MNLDTYKKAKDLLLEIQRTDEVLEHFRASELTLSDTYRLELNGLSVAITKEFYRILEITIANRIEELNVRFEDL